MDTEKTSSSFSFLANGESVPGQLTWVNARTFVFAPNTQLQPATVYLAVFSTQAIAKDGTFPQKNIEIEFKTIEAFAVAQVFPAPDTQEVDLTSSVTVIFNHPIVPVTIKEEQGKLPQPLKFTPEIKGQGEWVSSSVYVFQPEKILLSGIDYQVRIDEGIKDTLGNTLDKPYSWQFNTRAPVIYKFVLKDGAQNPSKEMKDVPLNQSFVVTFLQAMNRESVAKAVSLVNSETNEAFPVKLNWNEQSTELTIEPIDKYQLGGFYTLKISDLAQAADGGMLKEGRTLNFSAVPYPSIISFNPNPASNSLRDFSPYVTVTFASPMNADSLKSRVQITPKPKGEISYYYDAYYRMLEIYGVQSSTEYVVRLLPGMADVYGNTIKDETSFTFTTAAYSYADIVLPALYNQAPLVYRARGPQEVFFEHLNLEWATISLYSVSSVWDHVAKTAQPLREWQLKADKLNEFGRLNIKLEDKDGSPLPPGYYVITIDGPPLEHGSIKKVYDSALFIVATDNITFKVTGNEALAWVTDLETGKPQVDVNVTFYDEKYKAVGTVKTDGNGLAYLSGVKNTTFVQVTGKDHLAFASITWGSGVSAGDYGLYETYYSNTNTPFAYLYTDRPIYRPGQDVFFKGIVRQNNDLHYSLTLWKRVYVTIEHWGKEVYTGYINLSEMGSFTDKFSLDDNAALGEYDIYMRYSPKDDFFARLPFNVVEYHKPEFEVTAGADQTNVLSGATVNFSVDTAYYSGGSVDKAGVDWFIQTKPFYFQPSDNYSKFNFSDWDRDKYWLPQESSGKGTVAEGMDITDKNGHLEISQIVSASTPSASQIVSFSANVTDVGGNLVGGGTSVVVHASEVYAGIRSEKYISKVGEKQNFEVVALDWDSNPIPGQVMSVKFIERKWYSVQEQDNQGQLRWVTSVKDIPVGTQTATTSENGTASISFTPPNGGIFKAIVTTKDAKGNIHQSSSYVWILSYVSVNWKQTNDRTFSLVADKDSYSPGETAEILIAQPFEGEVYALVTYERGRIHKRDVVLLKGTSTIYKIPITDDMSPMMYISMVVISGAENTGRPNFKTGMTKINIDVTQYALDVSVTTDKKSAGPGDEVTYTITTKDNSGKPVSADVSLAVVDKAALALSAANSKSPLDSFYPDQSLGVQTAVGLVTSADDFNENYRSSIPDGGGEGGGNSGDGNRGILTVRQDFKDTIVFKGMITTDKNGEAQVSVTLPENLTTWQADVRAFTTDGKVGQAVNEVVSAKPFFVEMTTPRFFVVGDEAQVGAVIHNNTVSKLKVNVNLIAEGVVLNNETSQSVEVEAKGQTYVTWMLTVEDVTRVDLTAHASSGNYEDSSKPALGTLDKQGIPVYSFTVVETVGTSGILLDANSVTEGVQLPTSLNFTNAKLSIEVSPSLAASMQSGLTYLKNYPFECAEQTISRFLPNVITTRALETAGLADPKLKSKLDELVNTALQGMYTYQNYDGGWDWCGGETSDPQPSAYVVYGLLEARESGYAVSETVLNNGIKYLKNNLPTLNLNDAPWQYNRQAFILYVLARGGQLGAGQTNDIYGNKEMLSVYGKAYLAQAIHLLNPEDKRINALVSDLISASVLSASGAHWEESETDYWNWNTNTRTTAITLNALAQIDPKNPITANTVRWLMAHRNNSGHWYSTQETTWSLIALTNWLVATKEYETNYKYAVGLNGELLKEGQADKSNLTDSINLEVQLKDLLKEQVNSLVITRGRGMGNLYYTAYLDASLPVESIQPLDQGVSLAREYFTLDDPKTPITEIKRGEIVRVRLTIVAPTGLHYLVIDDPLPAGFEAVDSSLNTSMEVPLNYTRPNYYERGWGWWYFSHKEIHDEKIVISTDYLPAGTYVYTYLTRASTAGTFKVIPPTASEFYFPDVGGRGAGSLFVVK